MIMTDLTEERLFEIYTESLKNYLNNYIIDSLNSDDNLKELMKTLNGEVKDCNFKSYVLEDSNKREFRLYLDLVKQVTNDENLTTIENCSFENSIKEIIQEKIKEIYTNNSELKKIGEVFVNFIEKDTLPLFTEEKVIEKYNTFTTAIQKTIADFFGSKHVDELIDKMARFRNELNNLCIDVDNIIAEINSIINSEFLDESLLKDKINGVTNFKKYYSCISIGNGKTTFIRRTNIAIVKKTEGENETTNFVPKLYFQRNSEGKIEGVGKEDISDELYEVKKIRVKECPDNMVPNCINGRDSVNVIQNVYHFNFSEELSNANQIVWVSGADCKVKNAKITFSRDKGWSYQIEGIEGKDAVQEFSVTIYQNQPSTSTGVGKGFMNGHHGIPSEWAIAESHCGEKYYNPDDAPVIMLRDTIFGTTHRFVTTLQNTWKAKNKDRMTDKNCTYEEIRRVSMEQLLIVAEAINEKNLGFIKNYEIEIQKQQGDGDRILKFDGTDDKNKRILLSQQPKENDKIKKQNHQFIKDYFIAADEYFKKIYQDMLEDENIAIKDKASDIFSSYFGDIQ